MATMYQEEEERRPRLWLWILILVLVAFVGGVIVSAYVVSHDTRSQHFLGLVTAQQAEMERQLGQRIVVRPAAAAPAQPQAPASRDEIDARVTTLEGQVGDIENQARAATGDAARAESLLVAFAARRALDRGVALGYIESLLRQRFGASQAQAVAAILSASRQPVTLADLETGLDALAPTLSMGGVPQQSWWQSFRQELSNMVVVRKTGEPSTVPADRVARAQRMLEAGQVDSAMAEIMRLPDHRAADKWVLSARRYVIGRGALDQIETAALLDPAINPGLHAQPAAPAPSASSAAPDKAPTHVPVD